MQQQKAIEFAERASYRGVIYSRKFDPYDERPHGGLEPAEHWIADILQPVLLAIYPPFPPDKKMNYSLLLPEPVTTADAHEVRLLGCVGADKEDATWKEVVVLRHRKLVLAYNLISHARRMYRVLIYASDHRFSLHNLAPNVDPRSAPRPPLLLRQAGSFRSQRAHEASLLIARRNVHIGGHETLQPKRLLAGLIPGALLESHNFWRGEDGLLRGEPLEADSQWFNYNVLVRIDTSADGCGRARVWRLPTSVRTPIHNAREAVTAGTMLVRQTSASRPAPAAVKYDENSVAELIALGFSAAAVRRALRECQHNRIRAASWLFDVSNQAAISEAVREEASQAPTEDAAVDEELLASLMSMGFSQPAARHALAIHGQLESALSWLAEPANASEIERVELAAASSDSTPPATLSNGSAASAATSSTSAPSNVQGEGQPRPGLPGPLTTQAAHSQSGTDAAASAQDEPMGISPAASPRKKATEPAVSARLELLDLLSAPADSPLYRLASVLTRVEDLSHILAWGQPCADESGLGISMRIEMVELPRLKVSELW